MWAFALCEVGNHEKVITGTNIDDFIEWCERAGNDKIYMHNLKFDGQFIISWLLRNGFQHTTERLDRKSRTFNTLISDKGFFYSIEIVFKLKGKNINKITIQDSMKLLPMSVEKIAESFNMPIRKLSIDYSSHNDLPPDTPLTDAEKEYISHDVQIVATALDFFQRQGLTRMTIGSCALHEYKTLIGKKLFDRYFPEPRNYHDDIKQAYKGGFTFVNPKFAGKTVRGGFVLDENSAFAAVMKDELLPWGTPVFYVGKYKPDIVYPLYTQKISCQFELKPGKIPTIQSKDPMFYRGSEYVTSSEDEIVTLYLNSVDLALFLENYDVYNIKYHAGWKFRAERGLFDEYIDKWYNNKNRAKEENNPGLYLISKQFLTALYGKFGTNTTVREKIPKLTTTGAVIYEDSELKPKKGVYVAMASFITSYARERVIRAAQRITDDYNAGISDVQFVYSDTDSLHILSPDGEIPAWLDIDDSRLGAWKIENRFRRARYLRQKCYIMERAKDIYNPDSGYSLKVVVAGMPENCGDQVTFDNFKIGATYTDKKQPVAVPGGVVLKSIDFTIKR